MIARVVTALAAGGFALYGCDLTQKATASRLAAATLLASPAYTLTFTVDGGAFDAGTLPGQTVAALYFGERESDSAAPRGLLGAKVTVAFPAVAAGLSLGDKGAGQYTLDSIQDAKLAYVAGALYTFKMVHGDTYTGAVKAPPQETISQFHPSPFRPISQTVSTPLTLNRKVLGPGEVRKAAFTVVTPLDANGQKGTSPTFSDVPSDATALLDFVINDGKWKKDTIELPATAFPQAKTRYLVAVTAVEKGSQDQFSSNLFIGSAFVAGSSDFGLVETR